eukprot:COSAG06_NODE_14636_length_1140_cov_1.703170_1_plen_121_part_00
MAPCRRLRPRVELRCADTVLCVVVCRAMDVDDDAQLPAHGAVAASHAASAASVLARSDGTGDYVIRDFYDNDKKCLACNKKISCAGVDRLRFHLLLPPPLLLLPPPLLPPPLLPPPLLAQ